MRILIDLQPLQTVSSHGGIGRYAKEFAKNLIINFHIEHEFSLLLNAGLPKIQQIRHEFKDLISPNRIFEFISFPSISAKDRNASLTKLSELMREKTIFDINPDLLVITSVFEGFADDAVISVGNIFPAEKTAAILYDLIPLAEPETYFKDKDAESHYMAKLSEIQKANALLAISEYSLQEAIASGLFAKKHIANISSAVNVSENHTEGMREFNPEELLKGSQKKYLLYVSSFDQRKNHARLIEAYSKLPKQILTNFDLVIVGNGHEGIYDHYRKLARRLGIEENSIKFTGKVTDADLVTLYKNTDLLVFPSLREGFGLPILEAMELGVAVIGSNTTSIKEVIDNPLYTFDPYSSEAIAQAITDSILTPNRLEEMRRHSLTRAQDFSWKNTATLAMQFLKKGVSHESGQSSQHVAESNNTLSHFVKYRKLLSFDDAVKLAWGIEQNELEARRTISATEKIKFAVITTWNTKCGIATYASDFCNSMYTNPDIFAPADQERTGKDHDRIFRTWNIKKPNLQKTVSAIQAGNYDVVLIQFNFGFYDLKDLHSSIMKLKKAEKLVFIDFHATYGNPDKDLFDIRQSLANCDALFVHSADALAFMTRLGLEANTYFLPLGIKEFRKQETEPEKSTKDSKGLTFATYGFALPHKGLLEVLEAFQSVLRERPNEPQIKLKMLNAEYPAEVSKVHIENIKEKIQTLGLQDSVVLKSDYLSEKEISDEFATVDVAIFAYQHTDESSSAAVRKALENKRITLVTPIKIFQELRSISYQIKGTSGPDIAQGMEWIIQELIFEKSRVSEKKALLNLWLENHQFSNMSNFIEKLAQKKLPGGRGNA